MRLKKEKAIVNWELIEFLQFDRTYNEAKEIYNCIVDMVNEDDKKIKEQQENEERLRQIFINGCGYKRYDEIAMNF